jgi:pimeloyl-ACP methyl ester carboxylesterase
VPVETAKLFEKMSGARVACVNGAGHSPMIEKPAQTLELIKSFLSAER